MLLRMSTQMLTRTFQVCQIIYLGRAVSSATTRTLKLRLSCPLWQTLQFFTRNFTTTCCSAYTLSILLTEHIYMIHFEPALQLICWVGRFENCAVGTKSSHDTVVHHSMLAKLPFRRKKTSFVTFDMFVRCDEGEGEI